MSGSHPLHRRRLAGTLLHPTSLPASPGSAAFIGDLGPASRKFISWLHAAGFGLWQMLPIGPVGKGNSPYSAISSFAIEPMLISLEDLVEKGRLPSTAVRVPRKDMPPRNDRVDWRGARKFKEPRLQKAFKRFCRTPSGRIPFNRFQREHAHWLGDFCNWKANRDGSDPDYHAFVQFILEEQWHALRALAHRNRINLLGDLPIFVGADSADVSENPDLFRLNKKGKPILVTGVPPDCFSKNGQLWGHPHYRWPAHRKQNYQWWCDRVRTSLHRFDLLRIDHFVGFVHAFEISARAKTARGGTWRKTPGRELLQTLRASLGPLPFIAEDLGNRTAAVNRMRKDFGLPGMEILQQAVLENNSKPEPVNTAVYPGTHDNDTIRGWWRTRTPSQRKQAASRLGTSSSNDIAPAMIRLALESRARTAIIQMQDLLNLGSAARMNRPGIALDNWRWRMETKDFRAPLARELRTQITATKRLPTRR